MYFTFAIYLRAWINSDGNFTKAKKKMVKKRINLLFRFAQVIQR